MKIYIAGPMRGLPQFNFPLFDAVAATLRAKGYDVISPAEQDSPEIRAKSLASATGIFTPDMAKTESVGTILGRDTRLVIDEVSHIALLPAWSKSTGARLEVCVALLHGKGFFSVQGNGGSDNYTITPAPVDAVRAAFLEAMK